METTTTTLTMAPNLTIGGVTETYRQALDQQREMGPQYLLQGNKLWKREWTPCQDSTSGLKIVWVPTVVPMMLDPTNHTKPPTNITVVPPMEE